MMRPLIWLLLLSMMPTPCASNSHGNKHCFVQCCMKYASKKHKVSPRLFCKLKAAVAPKYLANCDSAPSNKLCSCVSACRKPKPTPAPSTFPTPLYEAVSRPKRHDVQGHVVDDDGRAVADDDHTEKANAKQSHTCESFIHSTCPGLDGKACLACTQDHQVQIMAHGCFSDRVYALCGADYKEYARLKIAEQQRAFRNKATPAPATSGNLAGNLFG
jgi:hypothetical protein